MSFHIYKLGLVQQLTLPNTTIQSTRLSAIG